MSEVERLRAQVKNLQREIRIMQLSAEQRNRDLTALHYVWCSGGCKDGTVDLTEDLVRTAVRNVTRMVHRFNNVEFKKLDITDMHYYNSVVAKTKDHQQRNRR